MLRDGGRRRASSRTSYVREPGGRQLGHLPGWHPVSRRPYIDEHGNLDDFSSLTSASRTPPRARGVHLLGRDAGCADFAGGSSLCTPRADAGAGFGEGLEPIDLDADRELGERSSDETEMDRTDDGLVGGRHLQEAASTSPGSLSRSTGSTTGAGSRWRTKAQMSHPLSRASRWRCSAPRRRRRQSSTAERVGRPSLPVQP